MDEMTEYISIDQIASELGMKSGGNAHYWLDKLEIEPVGKVGRMNLYPLDSLEQVREARGNSWSQKSVSNGDKQEKACDHSWRQVGDVQDTGDMVEIYVYCTKCLEVKRVIASV